MTRSLGSPIDKRLAAQQAFVELTTCEGKLHALRKFVDRAGRDPNRWARNRVADAERALLMSGRQLARLGAAAVRVPGDRSDGWDGLLCDLSALRAELSRQVTEQELSGSALRHLHVREMDRVDGVLFETMHHVHRATFGAHEGDPVGVTKRSKQVDTLLRTCAQHMENAAAAPAAQPEALMDLAVQASTLLAGNLYDSLFVNTTDTGSLLAAFALFSSRWMARSCDCKSGRSESPLRPVATRRRLPHPPEPALVAAGESFIAALRSTQQVVPAQAMDTLANEWVALCADEPRAQGRWRLSELLRGMAAGARGDADLFKALRQALHFALAKVDPMQNQRTKPVLTMVIRAMSEPSRKQNGDAHVREA